MSKISLFNLAAQHTPQLQEKILKKWQKILKLTAFVGGEEVHNFERDFAKFCQTKHAIGVKSGTAALLLTLRALGISAGDEVITTANTFVATVDAIAFLGAKPVFVDIDPATGNIDPTLISQAITSKTKAILVVHLYGVPCLMNEVLKVAKKAKLPVVEDAAHAHGALFRNQPVGSFGKAGCFSFYPAKTLGATGDAGAVVTNDQKFARLVRMLADNGRIPGGEKYRHYQVSLNERVDALAAAALNLKLAQLKKWITKKQKIAAQYNTVFHKYQHPGMVIPANTVPSFYTYAIQVSDRENFQKFFAEKGIETGCYYPVPVHLQPSYRYLGYQKGDLPITEKFARQTVSLPIYPELTNLQIKKVCQVIKNYFDSLHD